MKRYELKKLNIKNLKGEFIMRNRLIEEHERVDFMSDIDREIRNEKINNFLKG